MASVVKLVGIDPRGLCTTYDFHLQPHGRYEHDSVYSAEYRCCGEEGRLHMLMYTDDRLLATFPLRLDPEPGLTHLTVFPAAGVELSCDVECDPDAEWGNGVYDFAVTVDGIVCDAADLVPPAPDT